MDEYGVDLDEVGQAIDSADVLVMRFQMLDDRLLVDFRTSSTEGPLVRVVPQAGSVEERFRALRRLRPAFPLPDRILAVVWPRGIPALVAAGVLSRLRDRLAALGGDAAMAACDAAYDELRAEEAALLQAAVRGGDGFQSLWEREA